MCLLTPQLAGRKKTAFAPIGGRELTVDGNMADPDYIAETYLQLHRQHRSTWAFEVVLRPWVEKW